jgi:hypothetical protein
MNENAEKNANKARIHNNYEIVIYLPLFRILDECTDVGIFI